MSNPSKYIIWTNGPMPRWGPGQTYLRLEHTLSGGVRLIACQRDGVRVEAGNLLEFQDDGEIYLYRSIESDANLPLNHSRLLVLRRGLSGRHVVGRTHYQPAEPFPPNPET